MGQENRRKVSRFKESELKQIVRDNTLGYMVRQLQEDRDHAGVEDLQNHLRKIRRQFRNERNNYFFSGITSIGMGVGIMGALATDSTFRYFLETVGGQHPDESDMLTLVGGATLAVGTAVYFGIGRIKKAIEPWYMTKRVHKAQLELDAYLEAYRRSDSAILEPSK